MITYPARVAFGAALVAAALLRSAAPLAAQADRSYPAVLLRLPASTRMLALGNMGVVGRDDDVLFYNPAQLVVARGTSLSAEQFSKSAHDAALSSVARFNTGGVAIGASYAEFSSEPGVYPVDRSSFNDGGASEDIDAELVAGIGQVFFKTRLGLAAKYVAEEIGGARAGRGAIDVGASRDFFGFNFGLAAQNIGAGFTPAPPFRSIALEQGVEASSDLPFRATLGASRGWQTTALDFAATAGVTSYANGFLAPAGGLEMGYSWLDGYTIALRGGARRPERGESPVTAGAGFTMDRLSIDYALDTSTRGRLAHRVGLRIR
jgi:hypothetical protein